ncbi:MAG: hypothetical protein JNN12_03320 [Bacteroidetes Order II. Incertae sedis bacterium]|nr:hypothetical protein [Bacteroidetes Order II. bacterium]
MTQLNLVQLHAFSILPKLETYFFGNEGTFFNPLSLEKLDDNRSYQGPPLDYTSSVLADSTGTYWFMYQAPNNFVSYQKDKQSGVRTVYIRVVLELKNGKKIALRKPLEVVHPPLILVHGFGSDAHTWDHFTTDGKTLWKEDPRFLIKRAINLKMPFGSFDENATYHGDYAPKPYQSLHPHPCRI